MYNHNNYILYKILSLCFYVLVFFLYGQTYFQDSVCIKAEFHLLSDKCL